MNALRRDVEAVGCYVVKYWQIPLRPIMSTATMAGVPSPIARAGPFGERTVAQKEAK